MSQENVEIVRRLYDAAAHRDSEAVLALYDPAVEVDMSRAPCRDLVGRSFYHGHDGLRTYFREWYSAWENVASDLEELIDAGERVIAVETTRGRGRVSGAEVELHQCMIWTLRADKIVRVESLEATREEALKVAGLRE
jgi:ketosteroid isomerase-like protein